MKTFVGITGTTGVGKSAVAVELAKMLHIDVISADSMQIYKGMNIGTAKITEEEKQGITHFMIDVVTPNIPFSSFDYQEMASKIIDKSPKISVVAGGTGFYFDSLLYPPEFGAGNESRKKELREIWKTEGLPKLQRMLKSLDEETIQTIDLSNPVRVMRAIEIAENGQQRAKGQGKVAPKYNCLLYVLQRNRQQLYDIIDKRVDAMFQKGLVEEVKSMVATYGICDTPAYAAIGYKEIIEYLQGKCSLQDAAEKIKLNTRHYAKRQITYFKKMNTRMTIDVEGLSHTEIAKKIFDDVKKSYEFKRK